MSLELICGGMVAPCDFAVVNYQRVYGKCGSVLAAGFYDRSKVRLKAILANLGNEDVRISGLTYSSSSDDTAWYGDFEEIRIGRESISYSSGISSDIGRKIIATTREDMEKDFYNFFMNHAATPFLEKWSKPLLKHLLETGDVSRIETEILGNEDATIVVNEKAVCVKDLIFLDVNKVNTKLMDCVVPALVKSGKMSISEKLQTPLHLSGSLDEYLGEHSQTFLDEMEKEIKPLTPLKSNVENLAFKKHSLFPQQAACAEGGKALYWNKKKYVVVNQGMGTGKTKEVLAMLESIAVEKYMKKHPNMSLKDVYLDKDAIKYRGIVTCPSHLVEKWAEEAMEEVPYVKVEIIKKLSQLIDLRSREVSGRELYIVSKDTAKLDTVKGPVPSKMKKKEIALAVCRDCLSMEDDFGNGKIVLKKGGADGCCPTCKGHNFKPVPYSHLGYEQPSTFYGLVCPECGELLLKNKDLKPDSSSFSTDGLVLTPKDFANKSSVNERCYHCGCFLWEDRVKPIGMKNEKELPVWYKVVHWKNFAKKNTDTAYVLKGHEEDYYNTLTCKEDIRISDKQYGPRRYALARFIKKYIHFDFCVLDECHKYLGNQSAQGVAAHELVKASDFTMLLTGTLSNGTANCFYQLFWMMEPRKMISKGYKYSTGELMRFCKKYGCVETVFEGQVDYRNRMSRGRQISSPRVKPGISPVVFGEFLMDCSVFLDISDMSKFLPPLHEKVELVEVPEDVKESYDRVLRLLKEESSGIGGLAAATEMLQFSLSYLDKPYGRTPIMHPFVKDNVMANPRNHDEYMDVDNLLPKEERLVDIVNKEISEDRNVFVFATFTGKPETNVNFRLKDIIEHHCNLHGRVAILESKSPKASDREKYIHEMAAKGIRVFITNPACVETGLDFRFEHNGKMYNYPTLVFYQIGYTLAVLWQASRRAYRLNQTEECRTYYFAYENTAQAAALEIMAKKIQASSAISGKFSGAGLAAMAKGVDARTLLAQKLAAGDTSSRETLDNMFDVLDSMNNAGKDDSDKGFIKSPTLFELIGGQTEEDMVNSILNLEFSDNKEPELQEVEEIVITEKKEPVGDLDLSLFNSLVNANAESEGNKTTNIADNSNEFTQLFFSLLIPGANSVTSDSKKTKKNKKISENQLSLF